MQWLWCNTVSHMDPKDISSAQGDRKEIFWRELLCALLMTHLDDLCAGTFLRYQLMLSWDPVLQSKFPAGLRVAAAARAVQLHQL